MQQQSWKHTRKSSRQNGARYCQGRALDISRMLDALQDADAGLYDCLHLNFTSEIPRSLMDSLAEGVPFFF